MPRRTYLKLDDRAWLERLYVDEHKSINTIAVIVGCSPGAVRSAIKCYGIPFRSPQLGPRRAARATIRDLDLAARLGMVAGKEVRA